MTEQPKGRTARKKVPLQSIKPWNDAPADDADVFALKALASGTASDVQQKRALDWIINVAAKTYEQPFHPGSHDETAFACGRQFVGQTIIGLMKFVPSKKETV